MIKRQGLNSSLALMIGVAAAFVLAIIPVQAIAVDCSMYTCTGADPDGNDTDSDGFTDFRECCGITLPGPAGGSIATCTGAPGEDRNSCVDPDTEDLFVIMTRATPTSNIAGFDPFSLVNAPLADGGLGVASHEITREQAGLDREITFDTTAGGNEVRGQKAIWVRESLYTGSEAFGEATFGTPNTVGLATIYTQEIIDFINAKCAGASQCRDISHSTDPPISELHHMQMQNTIAHEISHLVLLGVDWNDRFGGPHYKAGSGILMEQFTKYTQKGSKVTFYISTVYCPASQQGIVLK